MASSYRLGRADVGEPSRADGPDANFSRLVVDGKSKGARWKRA
jgi:hypothetical protein